ncbi:deoxyguanosinetriphosphate triphosphohydrolase [Variibacter gotjawalensis]|uniref:Deoxyguanosinetriphosphate triphosphohydrolase-like protein n=1 Tax=Variibacter gotjawalensis TaxID=1333996 RepID=A0A0S3PWP9_9BRAD|nr:deoxyguanosinetriphosphate triphosphohydrolase [Variibacter gotjawalensis]NIK46169.1 dGTPase [Variibacter gotjawalensis]RZS48086.1 dGTPase [Variibacter gotjawalensis]BAT60343.1 deoxyguanosinetriphosphate triphosphohydrolase [Variibacter gotjawalensis]
MAVDSGRERAPYALHPRESRGRRYPETESPARNVFRRDCDRIIHSAAFRRLKHKTQVFVVHEGDHYRTRLTHTLEVTQIARSLSRALGLDEDLAEALALAHDLGHPPFGHAGERALDEQLRPFGGFDHNAQSLRVVTELERRYAAFDGLNLTYETIEGLLKHNGPLTSPDGAPVERYAHGIPAPMATIADQYAIPLGTYGSAEAQAAAVADDIAYDAHDIDDGLRAELFTIDDLKTVPLLGDILAEIAQRHGNLDPPRQAHELVRRLITRMVEDVVSASNARLIETAPATPHAVRDVGKLLVGFSPAMQEADREIKGFLFPRMYRHERVMQVMLEATQVVSDLFVLLSREPSRMPEEWREGLETEAKTARRVGDFIAGMTDNFALTEHARFFDSTPDLR